MTKLLIEIETSVGEEYCGLCHFLGSDKWCWYLGNKLTVDNYGDSLSVHIAKTERAYPKFYNLGEQGRLDI